MNYAIIGDIHGMAGQYKDLLEQIKRKYPQHRIIVTGDMIDRGRDSYECMEISKRLEAEGHVVLLGNHEDWMIDIVKSGMARDSSWFYPNNGGTKTIDSYGRATGLYGKGKFPMALNKAMHWGWVNRLPLYFETDELWVSHAPIPKTGRRREGDFRLDRHALTWSWHGHTALSEEAFLYDHGKLAVYGHVHNLDSHAKGFRAYEPRIYDTGIYIDTGAGCYYEAPLSAAIVENGKYVRCLQTWNPTVETRTL